MKSFILIFCLLVSSFCIESNAQVQEVQRSKETGMLMKWIIPPKIRIDNEILEGYDRDLLIYLETDENGRVQKAEVSKSSGVDELDRLVLRAVKRSKLKVWNEWDIKTNHPSRLKLPFEFSVSRIPEYAVYPEFTYTNADLKGSDRTIRLSVEANEKGKLTKVKVFRGTGIPTLDKYVLSEFIKQASFKPLIINGKPQLIKTTADFSFILRSSSD
ncbi:TonB family protein [Acinetobacter sp. RIT698]|uniref:TonB family protein n=1 Tax=Acinetobacter sp. RIT698 TaxID=2666192 RepID=UPI0012AC7C57|nr:TonB family protein [Acinetobacter sp. RIT698]MRT39217.1 TonB family protein [Acinetobacter sp. RIT698]